MHTSINIYCLLKLYFFLQIASRHDYNLQECTSTKHVLFLIMKNNLIANFSALVSSQWFRSHRKDTFIGKENMFFMSVYAIYIIPTKLNWAMFQCNLFPSLWYAQMLYRSLKLKSRTQFNFEHPEGSFITFITQVL